LILFEALQSKNCRLLIKDSLPLLFPVSSHTSVQFMLRFITYTYKLRNWMLLMTSNQFQDLLNQLKGKTVKTAYFSAAWIAVKMEWRMHEWSSEERLEIVN